MKIQILRHPALAIEMGNKARELVLQNFSVDQKSARVFEHYAGPYVW